MRGLRRLRRTRKQYESLMRMKKKRPHNQRSQRQGLRMEAGSGEVEGEVEEEGVQA